MKKLYVTNHLYKAVAGPGAALPQTMTKLVCAKNEKPRFVAVIDNKGKASRLICDASPSLGLTPLLRYRLAIVGPFDCEVSPIGYLPDNQGVKVSDIVKAGSSHDFCGDEFPIVTIDVVLPKEIQSGEYKIRIQLFESRNLNDEKKVEEEELILVVRNYRLPTPDQFYTYVDIWQHNATIARTYGVSLWSEAHFEKIGKVLEKLRSIGQKSITVVVSDCPWRGWGCNLVRDTPANLFEYNIVRVTKNLKGTFDYDYTALDKLLDLYYKYGICGDVTVYGLLGIWKMPYFDTAEVDYPEQIKIGYIDAQDGSRKFMTQRVHILDYIQSLFQHFIELGVWDRVRIGADEPSNAESFLENLKYLKEQAKDVKLKIAIDNPKIIERIGSQCTDICLSFPCTLKNYKNTNLTASRKLWYVCNIPVSPNSVFHNSLSETAALGVLNQVFGLDGFLRWAFTCWTMHPLEDIRFNVNGLPAGDTCLVYPSMAGGVWESVRFHALKFGILLNELLLRVHPDLEAYNKLLALVVGKNKMFYNIVNDLGVSVNAEDYMRLYDELLQYFEQNGGVL